MARSFNQTYIDTKIGHRIDNVLAVAHAHIQRQLGKIPSIVGNDLRQDVIANRTAGVDANCAIFFTKQLLNFRRLLQQRQRPG
jgi:hypothetical protein